jgi:hypothetical protein
MKRCPFPLCTSTREDNYFACSGHWRSMPPALRALAFDLIKDRLNKAISQADFERRRLVIIEICVQAWNEERDQRLAGSPLESGEGQASGPPL